MSLESLRSSGGKSSRFRFTKTEDDRFSRSEVSEVSEKIHQESPKTASFPAKLSGWLRLLQNLNLSTSISFIREDQNGT